MSAIFNVISSNNSTIDFNNKGISNLSSLSVTSFNPTSISLSSTTDSTSIVTGSFVTPGGAGIAKSLFVGGTLNVTDTTDSTSTVSGSFVTGGGVGIAKKLFVGSNTASTNSSIGAIVSSGGISIALNTDATSSSNGGTITTAGGIAVAKKAFIGTSLSVGTILTVNSTSNLSGATNFIATSSSVDPTLAVYGGINIAPDGPTSVGTALGSGLFVGGGTGTINYSNAVVSPSPSAVAYFQNMTIQTPTTTTIPLASTVYIAGAPFSGSNVTFTNSYSLYIGAGIFKSNDATNSFSSTTGSITTRGGIGVEKDIVVGGNITTVGTVNLSVPSVPVTTGISNVTSISTSKRFLIQNGTIYTYNVLFSVTPTASNTITTFSFTAPGKSALFSSIFDLYSVSSGYDANLLSVNNLFCSSLNGTTSCSVSFTSNSTSDHYITLIVSYFQ